MTTKERLINFLTYLNISQGKFEKKVGLATGFVNNVGDSIRKTSLKKITNIYPQLNTAWLLTGEGEMLKNISENSENLTQQTITEDRNNSIDELINIRIEKAVMENLDKIIATIMEGTNKSNQQQNAHVENILKMQSDENAKKFNTLIEAIREIIKDEDRDKFEQKIIPLKTKIG